MKRVKWNGELRFKKAAIQGVQRLQKLSVAIRERVDEENC